MALYLLEEIPFLFVTLYVLVLLFLLILYIMMNLCHRCCLMRRKDPYMTAMMKQVQRGTTLTLASILKGYF
jgi:hypothetical protein